MKSKKTNLLVNLAFLVLTFVYMYSFIKLGNFNVQSDASFHLQRANEIYQNLKSGSLFTFISTHSFGNSGVGSFLFYPSVPLYILAFLRLTFNPITSIYLWIGLFMFLTQAIAFFAMQRFSSNNVRAFIFAELYSIAPYHLYLGLWNSVWGEFTAYTFIPLVFLGIYEILWKNKNNSWIILAIGMSLLCYCHVVTTYIATALCILLFVIKLIISKINKLQFVSLIKAGLLTIILSGWEFIPFLTDYIGKKIISPKPCFYFVEDLGNLIADSFSNNLHQNLGIILIITLIVGSAFKCVQQSTSELSIYFLGSFLTICASSIIPYTLLSNNKIALYTLGNIQFPYRLLSFSGLFLSATASLIISGFLKDFSNKSKKIILFGMAILSMIFYFGTIQPELNLIGENSKENTLKKANFNNRHLIPQPILINKHNYRYLVNYNTSTGNEDYYPQKAIKYSDSILNGQTFIGNKLIKISRVSKPNFEKFKLITDKTNKLNTPIIAYSRTYVKVNGKKQKFKISNRGTVEIQLNKGKNVIQIGYKPSKLYYLGFIIAILGWVSLIIKIFIKSKI